MRVAVTGASGNVGTSVLDELDRAATVDDVVAVARRPPSWTTSKQRWVACDLAHGDVDTALAGCDAVVHLAWAFQPTHDPVVTWRNNVLGTLRVLDAARRDGASTVVIASSIGAYAPAPDDDPVDETWPTHALPVAAYGREKSYLERVLDTFERDNPGIRVVRFRPAFIFKRQAAHAQRQIFLGPFVPDRLVDRGLIPVIPAIPGLRLQALHSADVADAFVRALHTDVSGAYNLAPDDVLTVHDLAQLVHARAVPVPRWLARAGLAAAWHARAVPASPGLLELFLSLPVLSNERARRDLGWRPRAGSREAILELFAGTREARSPSTPALESPDLGPVPAGLGAR